MKKIVSKECNFIKSSNVCAFELFTGRINRVFSALFPQFSTYEAGKMKSRQGTGNGNAIATKSHKSFYGGSSAITCKRTFEPGWKKIYETRVRKSFGFSEHFDYF